MLIVKRINTGVSRFKYGQKRQSPLTAARRHWITFWRYNTWKKMFNLVSVLIHFLSKRPVVKGYPFMLKVEPTTRCNLKCPGCVAHGTDFPIIDADMSLEMFQKLCDEIGEYLYKISLYITGEPLLNNKIYDMIAYATHKRIGTVISTNFHAFNENKAEKMIAAGLSHIIVCLDGISQEVYQKYRVGGDLDRVLKNLDTLINKKKETGSRLPFIEIQAIANEFNADELPQIQELAVKLNVDRFTIREDLRSYQPAKVDKTCFWLWFTALVTEKGVVNPCCASAWWQNPKKVFGDLSSDSFRDIWNGSKYRKARSVFCGSGAKATDSDSLCYDCDIFRCLR